jgi:CoA:oxalate CoA-transferase
MPTPQSPAGPLANLVVIDLTRVLSGPYCTLLLSDLGARVIKVESPGGGDDSRRFAPFHDGESAYFAAFNRGKESIALDLKSPADREVLDRMLDTADVIIDNFRPGVMERLGLGRETLEQRWPRLIQASISGFGQAGPEAGRTAYDLVMQGMGGVMAVTGAEGGGPARAGTSLVDIGTGMFTAIGILAAVNERAASGRGRFVDIAMLDCTVAMLEHALLRAQLSPPVVRTGSRFATHCPSDAYRTRDGALIVAAGNEAHFRLAMSALGLDHLVADPRFVDIPTRVTNNVALKAEMEAVMQTRDTAHWDAALSAAGVPCGPLREVAELLEDPTLQLRGMLPQWRGLKVAGCPINISGYAKAEASPDPPALDQDRAAVLAGLGL